MTLDAFTSAAMIAAASKGDDLSMARLFTEGQSRRTAVVLSAASQQLNRAQHEGRTLLLSRAAGCIAILPKATGSADRYSFFQAIAAVGAPSIVRVFDNVDQIAGCVLAATSAAAAILGEAATGTDDTMSMNGGTTGGLIGSWAEFEDVSAGQWCLRGMLVCSGTFVTPFSAAV